MRDSRLFDSVVSYASDQADVTDAEGPGETEDPWRLADLESEEERPDSRLGQILGSIRLEGLAGQGGMGTVFEGWDEKLQRKVAVKAISHRYRHHSEARQRFLREARLLSKLQHPNICQIHDHIEGDDGDYLVLELVDGRSLRSTLEEGGTFTQAEGLRISRQLAAALVAAHDRGVAHRDLKPANIMVTSDGTVKVLDFGLGLSVERAVEKESAEAGLEWTESGSIQRPELSDLPSRTQGLDDSVTAVGGRRDTRSFPTSSGSIEGTLAYMSPEQARSQEAGTASDIYSLGLVLQEIFTGQGAYPPDLPATHHLVRAGQGDTLPVTGIDSDLARLIERMKSVAPGSRPSAPDVADRLQWIAQKPVRRLRALALGAFVALLVAFSVVMAYQRSRIAEEAARANREAESARQVTEYLKGVFEVADPWNAESSNISARELLERGVERIRAELDDQPLIRARLLSTMGEVNRRIGEFKQSRPLLEEALALQREHGADPRDLAETLSAFGLLEADDGKYDRSAEIFRETIDIQAAHLGPTNLSLAQSMLNLGCAEHYRGELDEAKRLYQDALTMFEEVVGPDHLETAEAVSQLALTMTQLGKYDSAEELHRRASGLREDLLPADHPDLGISYHNFGSMLYDLGHLEEASSLLLRAIRIWQESLGPDHPDLVYGHRSLSLTLSKLGRFEEAETHSLRALEIQRKNLPNDHPQIPSSLDRLALVRLTLGQPEDAEALLRESIAMRRVENRPNLAGSLYFLGEALTDLGRLTEAADVQREALEIRLEHRGASDPATARARLALGRTLLELSRLDEADRQLQAALLVARASRESSEGDAASTRLLAEVLLELGRLEARSGDDVESTKLATEAVAILEPLAPATEDVTDDLVLVEALSAVGRAEEAEPLARRLLDAGYGRPDFVELCREQGWTS